MQIEKGKHPKIFNLDFLLKNIVDQIEMGGGRKGEQPKHMQMSVSKQQDWEKHNPAFTKVSFTECPKPNTYLTFSHLGFLVMLPFVREENGWRRRSYVVRDVRVKSVLLLRWQCGKKQKQGGRGALVEVTTTSGGWRQRRRQEVGGYGDLPKIEKSKEEDGRDLGERRLKMCRGF